MLQAIILYSFEHYKSNYFEQRIRIVNNFRIRQPILESLSNSLKLTAQCKDLP